MVKRTTSEDFPTNAKYVVDKKFSKSDKIKLEKHAKQISKLDRQQRRYSSVGSMIYNPKKHKKWKKLQNRKDREWYKLKLIFNKYKNR